MSELLCRECKTRPAITDNGYCRECYSALAYGHVSDSQDSADGTPHVSEATAASPTLGKLESAVAGWTIIGVIGIILGPIIYALSLQNYDPTAGVTWGMIITGIGVLGVQFGVLFFLISRHARVQVEAALYVRDTSSTSK